MTRGAPNASAWGASLAAMLLLGAAPLNSSSPPAASPVGQDKANASAATTAEAVAELKALQDADRRVADIAWQLLARAGDRCPDQGGATGINLHGVGQYAPAVRDSARAAFGFVGTYPSILTAARGSPGAEAGLLPGDAVLTVNGEGLAGGADQAAAADYGQIDSAMRTLEALPAGRPAEIRISRGGGPLTVTIVPALVCKSRVELAPGPTVNGNANGHVVQVSGGLVDWTQSDDELALVIAHEIAHNILGHQAEIRREGISTGLFGGLGKSGRRLRDMEREADRLGTWLSARAGFNYRIAPQFWERLARQPGLGALLATTHPAPASRRQSLEAVVADIDKAELGS